MQLYYAPGTITIAVAIALQEAGLEYEAFLERYAAPDQRERWQTLRQQVSFTDNQVELL